MRVNSQGSSRQVTLTPSLLVNVSVANYMETTLLRLLLLVATATSTTIIATITTISIITIATTRSTTTLAAAVRTACEGEHCHDAVQAIQGPDMCSAAWIPGILGDPIGSYRTSIGSYWIL